MSIQMKISVVIPTHDRRAILEHTLDALASQSVKGFEVLVVSDAVDGTNEMVEKRKGVRLIHSSNRWPDVKRNMGIAEAKGDIIAFTDDDCIPRKDWIEKLLKRFSDKSVLGVEGKTTKDTKHLFSHATENLQGGQYPTCNLAFRKSVLKDVGGFDEAYHYFREDTDLAFRVLEKGPITFAPEVEVFHPARRVRWRTIFRELRLIRGDIRLWKKLPVPYKATYGMVGGGGLKLAGVAWCAILLSFVHPITGLLGLLASLGLKYTLNLRRKEWSLTEGLAFLVLSTIRDVLYPFFFVYYLATEHISPE